MRLDSFREMGKIIASHIRPATFPIALKFFERKEDVLDDLARVDRKMTHCQAISISRRYGRSLYMTYDDFVPYCFAPFIYGFLEIRKQEDFPGIAESGVMYACSSVEAAIKTLETVPFLPYTKYEYVAFSPLEWTKIEPQLVIIYGNPAQMLRVIQGLSKYRDEGAYFRCIFSYGWSLCSNGIAQSLMTGEPQFFLPDYGERRFAMVTDDEMGAVIPASQLDDFVKGLEDTFKLGARYPIPFYLDFSPMAELYSPLFNMVEERKELRKKHKR